MSPSIKGTKKTSSKLRNELKIPNNIQTNKEIEKNFDVMTVLRSLKEVQNAEFVGDNFVTEVKAIKSGKSKERAIYGNAKEVKDLKNTIDIIAITWVQDDH